MDLTVEGKIFLNGSFEKSCIGIENGKIVDVKKILKGDSHLDFGNKLIIPAGVDLHVHFRDPGMAHKEDFFTGSKSAAFGGIGCVFDMPNTSPQTTSVHSLHDKICDFSCKSIVDFGVYAGVTNSNVLNIDSLSEKCNGFKVFLGSSTNSLKIDKQSLVDAFERISSCGKLVLIHAEDEDCLNKNRVTALSLKEHLKSRPAVCEETAIQYIIDLVKKIGLNAHICHVSSCEGLEVLKNKPANLSCGVTPHHCLFSLDKELFSPSFYKVNPPIRTSFDRESLFSSLCSGFVDVLESDHAPHTKEEKSVDFNKAPSGVPGVETMFPLFLYMAKKEVISFQRLVSLMCSRPADIVGVSKGRIEKGYDADFIVIDFKEESRIKGEKLHYKCGWTPFEDWPAIFPKSVFIRGEKIIEGNEIQVSQGFGSFVGE